MKEVEISRKKDHFWSSQAIYQTHRHKHRHTLTDIYTHSHTHRHIYTAMDYKCELIIEGRIRLFKRTFGIVEYWIQGCICQANTLPLSNIHSPRILKTSYWVTSWLNMWLNFCFTILFIFVCNVLCHNVTYKGKYASHSQHTCRTLHCSSTSNSQQCCVVTEKLVRNNLFLVMEYGKLHHCSHWILWYFQFLEK